MKTIIEVGANDGDDTERLLDEGRNRVFSFEPIPEMIDVLTKRFAGESNYTLIPKAVDLEEGEAVFNIGQNDLSGVSSLYDLREESTSLLKGSELFDKAKSITVKKVRLDNFCHENHIAKIDYLWIDAQGADFRVLQSLGPLIDTVVEGKCEASQEADLYVGTDNHFRTIQNWLEERGFEVLVVPSGGNTEADVHFRKLK